MPSSNFELSDESGNHIRAIARALATLRLLNTGQRWTLHALHQQLGLPKSTVFRILATLQTEGYVQVDVAAGQYSLTRKVQELSSGYTEQSSILAAGAAIAIRVTREIKWPLAIGVRDGDALVVGCSTMPYSPLAVHATTIGTRLDLLTSAMGLAYMAHCSEQERGIVLQSLSASQPFEAASIKARLYEAHANGFAIRHSVRGRDSATLAVPVLHQGCAVAALGMTTFGRAMTRVTVEHFAPVLQQTATQISEAYAASAEEGTGTS